MIDKMFGIMEGAQGPHALIGTAACTYTGKQLSLCGITR